MKTSTSLSTKILADFRPFCGTRYDLSRVDIQNVMAPPYDVISPEEQNALYAKDPFNCIRLILNKETPQDHEGDSRYTRAAQCFNDWKKEGVLALESKPCFYYYRQVFKHPVSGELRERIALLGRLKLEAFDKKVVIPHEKTLSKPRADRRKLLEATRTNFSPVFGLYEYDHGQNEAIQQKVLSKEPLFETKDGEGVTHSLWAIEDVKIQEGIHEGLSRQRVYIADGHHRYQTSLEYAQEQRKIRNVPESEEIDSDFVLMALVHFYDKGMAILPTHRMILPFEGFAPARMVSALKDIFAVEAMPMEKILKKLHQSPACQDSAMQIGMYLENGETFLLTLRDFDAAKQKMPSGKAEIWYQLDVAVISHVILGGLWQIPETEWESKIRYTHSDREAIEQVRTQKVAASFFVKAPRVELLRDMGAASELMPQKSTYFYPKLASGLVFNEHLK